MFGPKLAGVTPDGAHGKMQQSSSPRRLWHALAYIESRSLPSGTILQDMCGASLRQARRMTHVPLTPAPTWHILSSYHRCIDSVCLMHSSLFFCYKMHKAYGLGPWLSLGVSPLLLCYKMHKAYGLGPWLSLGVSPPLLHCSGICLLEE